MIRHHLSPAAGIYWSFIFFMFACQSDPDLISESIPPMENQLELSHAPSGKIHIADAKVEIDFGCDEYMASHIFSEYGLAAIDKISLRGELIRFYERRNPVFEDMYSSFFDPLNDNNYVLAKLEYLLAQECVQDNCSSPTRRAILRIAVDKQKHKYGEHKLSYATRQTGIFLIAVILVRENDADFISAVHEHTDFQNALLLNQYIRTDKEFADMLIRYAEQQLSVKNES
jgi:hypothetical protein